tara:strand:- start:334 stop:1014 length:681 start_codon:yes stop_codon:yes gene_type:complete
MEIKYYKIIIFLFCWLFSNTTEYSVQLYGVPMANVMMSSQDTIYNDINACKIKFETQTNQIISTIFKIDNIYETIIKKDNFEILSFKKDTYQPDVINKVYTISSIEGIKYPESNFIIPRDCFNIFSLLYYLSITSFDQIKNKVILEREGLLYQCIIDKKIINHLTYEIALKFELINNENKPIIKNTDIFTWGLFKDDAIKKVIIKNSKIQKCKFKVGLSNLEANIK